MVRDFATEEEKSMCHHADGVILTRCGFRCDICPAYERNIGGPADLEAIRRGWRKYFGFDIPEDRIACVGCLKEGRHADADCPVRPCAIERRVVTCADCPDFGCEKLNSRTDFAEAVIPKFGDIPHKDFESYFRPYLSRERLEKIRRDRSQS
jgi:hypothetical protein